MSTVVCRLIGVTLGRNQQRTISTLRGLPAVAVSASSQAIHPALATSGGSPTGPRPRHTRRSACGRPPPPGESRRASRFTVLLAATFTVLTACSHVCGDTSYSFAFAWFQPSSKRESARPTSATVRPAASRTGFARVSRCDPVSGAFAIASSCDSSPLSAVSSAISSSPEDRPVPLALKDMPRSDVRQFVFLLIAAVGTAARRPASRYPA
jgi:hypothetical protein